MNIKKFLTLFTVIGILILAGCTATPYYGGNRHIYGYQAPYYDNRNYMGSYPYYNSRNTHSLGWHLHGKHKHHMHREHSHHNRGVHKHFGGGHRGSSHIRTHHH